MLPMSMFQDIWGSVADQLLSEVLRRAEIKHQVTLAKKIDIDEGTLSDYSNKKRGPTTKLAELAEAANLSSDQMGWLMGFLLEKKYHPHRFEIQLDSDEVREPQTPYGKPTLEEQLEIVMKLDLSGLEPDDKITLARGRAAIHKICQRTLATHRHLTSDFEEQLSAFHDSYQLAVRRARD